MKNKSFGALKKLKSLYYVSAIAVLLLSGSAALAVAPKVYDYGAYYGSAEIFKGDISPLDKNSFQMIYDGSYQEFLELSKAYRNKGTLYYKLGESGTWSNEAPYLKSAGKHNVYYYVDGDPNYNDFGSMSNPKRVVINIVDWGRKVINNGIINYVDSTGKTSAEVNKKAVIWVKEESEGKSSWYGLDNSGGFFEEGSRFWVKWLSEQSDPEEYQKYFDRLDDLYKKQCDEGNIRLFLIGVTKPDGTEYTNLPVKIPFYIQLDDDWHENNIHTFIVSASSNNAIDTQVNTASYFENRYGILKFPDAAGKYARLVIDCFAPYAICNTINSETAGDGDTSVLEGANAVGRVGNNIDNQGSYDSSFGYNTGFGVKFADELNNLSDYAKYENSNDYKDDGTNISEDSIDLPILEIAAIILLVGVLNLIFVIIYKRRNKDDDEENESL